MTTIYFFLKERALSNDDIVAGWIFRCVVAANNHADIPMPYGSRSTEFKGLVFLLPTVSEEEAKEHYPGHHSCDVPSKINYLRLVKKEDVEKKTSN